MRLECDNQTASRPILKGNMSRGVLQGQCGYSERRQHEMCSYDSAVEGDEIDFSMLFVAG